MVCCGATLSSTLLVHHCPEQTLRTQVEVTADQGQIDRTRAIARSLVDNPEQVSVSEVEGEQTSVLELKVAKEDLGKVIGKQGRTARAMRTILGAASTKTKKRAVLEILE